MEDKVDLFNKADHTAQRILGFSGDPEIVNLANLFILLYKDATAKNLEKLLFADPPDKATCEDGKICIHMIFADGSVNISYRNCTGCEECQGWKKFKDKRPLKQGGVEPKVWVYLDGEARIALFFAAGGYPQEPRGHLDLWKLQTYYVRSGVTLPIVSEEALPEHYWRPFIPQEPPEPPKLV